MSYVNVGQEKLFIREAGQGEPVVLLHGWPTNGELWRNQIPALAEIRRVIVPDLPGYGKSTVPTSIRFSFGYFVDVVEGLLKELGIDGCALVGHDLGGPVSMLLAARRPDNVTKLVLLNTTPYAEVPRPIKVMLRVGRLPGLRSFLTSRSGFRLMLYAGMVHADRKAALDRYYLPFEHNPSAGWGGSGDGDDLFPTLNYKRPLGLADEDDLAPVPAHPLRQERFEFLCRRRRADGVGQD